MSLNLILRTARPAGDANDLTPAEIDGNFVALRDAVQTLQTTVPATNQLPTVSFNQLNSNTPTVGIKKDFVCVATDSDGAIASVKLFLMPNAASTDVAQGTLLDTDTTSPYAVGWTPGAAGNFALRVLATDNQGGTTISPVLMVGVVNAGPLSVTNTDVSGGVKGTRVAIFGAGFGTSIANVTVDFNGAVASVTDVIDSRVLVLVPAGGTTGKINVTKGGSTVSTPNSFTVGTLDDTKKNQQFANGDSIVDGEGSTAGNDWPTQMYALQDHSVFDPIVKLGFPGYQLNQLNFLGADPNAPNYFADGQEGYHLIQYFQPAGHRQIIVSFNGGLVNSATYDKPWSELRVGMKQYVDNIRAWSAANNNYPVWIISQTPTLRGSNGNGGPFQYNADSSANNARIEEIRHGLLNEWRTYCGFDDCINFSQDSRMVDFTNHLYFLAVNTATGFKDELHFTDEGYAVHAAICKPYFDAAVNRVALGPKPDAV